MNNKLEEIRENINHIRTIPGGYNTANYSLLIEYVDYLLTQLAESQRREKAAVEQLSHVCNNCKSVNCKIKDNYNLLEIHTDATGQCNKWDWRGPVDEKGEG